MSRPLKTYNGHDGPKRERVQQWLNEQWRNGTLPRPSRCEACGQTGGPIHAHLENYDDRANYTELCAVCHMMIHCRERNPGPWAYYKYLVGTGYQHTTAYRGGAFMQVRSTVLRPGWQPPDYDLADRIDTYLDTLPPEQSAPGVNQQYDRGTTAGLF